MKVDTQQYISYATFVILFMIERVKYLFFARNRFLENPTEKLNFYTR